ncbi:hypothetical protein NP493_107g05045 [Ridgeia piscesae]|uniref:SH3 domain-containing protein n=1 Tax=Ridgeia piscesae TaxID=27915 RepID=A0AAD9UHD8_RIDPI|nr:hypothetical protein NP493_107g05045 [Ridgeia piscesae]
MTPYEFGNFQLLDTRLVNRNTFRRFSIVYLLQSCAQVPSTDVWVILDDYTATNDKELSVQKGQQVELLDSAPGGSTEWCLVRVLNGAGDSSSCGVQLEGRVPTTAIKQVTTALTVSSSHGSIDNDDSAPMNSSEAHTVSTPSASSPASKRKSSFRKWLSNPVRKRSQGRMDKTPDKSAPDTPHSGKMERKPSGSAKITAIKLLLGHKCRDQYRAR